MEDVHKIERHTLLGDDNFFRTFDEEISTLIKLAFTVSDSCFEIFSVKTAVLRENHYR